MTAFIDVAVVATPDAPGDVAFLLAQGAQRWDASRVEGGVTPVRARLVFLLVDAPAAVQQRWLAALGALVDADTTIALYAPRLSVSELAAAYPHPAQVVGVGFLDGRLAPGSVVEVAPGLRSAPGAVERVEAFFRQAGVATERVGDFSGLVLRRVLYMIINEATYALWEGVASREDIDLGMKLGVGYPFGPLEWADAIGLDRVHDGLRSLHEEYGDDRFRPCPLLRKMVAAGLTGRRAGAGFYTYGAAEGAR